MKKLIIFLMTLSLVLVLAACGECEHVYDNGCDTACNECGEQRATEHSWSGPDCDSARQCTECGLADGEPLGHNPNEDDGDCTTDITCSVCGEITTNKKSAHEPYEDDNDCTTALGCKNCDVIVVKGMTHDFSGEYVRTEAAHYHVCKNEGCNVFDSLDEHTGGEASCALGRCCTACEYEYTAPDNYNHSFDLVLGECTTCFERVEIDAVSLSGEELYREISERLRAGITDIKVTTAPDATDMVRLIRRAICDEEGIYNGTIDLTITGLTYIPSNERENTETDTTTDGLSFGIYSRDDNGEYIGEYEYVPQIRSVSIPDVTEIGSDAFSGCENLISIYAPKTKTLQAFVFENTSLKTVEFPEVTYINAYAFSGCRKLESAYLPKVTSIGSYAFAFTELNRLYLTAEASVYLNYETFGYSSKLSEAIYLVLNISKKDDISDNTFSGYTFKSIAYTCIDGSLNHTSTSATQNYDNTHTLEECEKCGQTITEPCHGGAASCFESAVCTVCNNSYGTVVNHKIDAKTGYCMYGCEKYMAVAKVTSGDYEAYYDSTSSLMMYQTPGATITLLEDIEDNYIEWFGVVYTVDLNGFSINRGGYELYGLGEGALLTVINSSEVRSSITSIYVSALADKLIIGSGVDVGKIVLVHSSEHYIIDLSDADFVGTEIELLEARINVSQIILPEGCVILDSSENVVTGELTADACYKVVKKT